jgi:DNA-binding HxlR family transcriptional regulator
MRLPTAICIIPMRGRTADDFFNGDRSVLQETTKMIVLASVGKHDRAWGWYQFERAYPPGSLPDPIRVMDVLNELENAGLVARIPNHPQPLYCLTQKGKDLLAV